MLAERTLLVVTDYDMFKLGEEQREKLVAFLEDIPPYCCVVFVYDLIAYKGDARTKLAAAIRDNGSIVEVFTDLTLWIGIKRVIDRINANALAA